MTTLINNVISCSLGLLFGLVYSLSFLSTGRRVLASSSANKYLIFTSLIGSTMARILVLALLFILLLRSTSINFILLVIAFFIGFLGIILTRGIQLHGRGKSA